MVSITPCAGFVGFPAALLIGVLGSAAANFGTRLKYYLKADDVLDIFAVHGLAGTVGSLLNGIFASKSIAALDGYTVIAGGWLNQNVGYFCLQHLLV